MQVSVLNTGGGTLAEQIEDFKDLLGLASQKPQTARGSCAQLTAGEIEGVCPAFIGGEIHITENEPF